MQHLLNSLVMGLIMICAGLLGTAKADGEEALKEEIVKALKAEGKTDAETAHIMSVLSGLDKGLESVITRLNKEGDLYALSEMAKVLVDLVEQADLLGGGKGCMVYVVYNHAKDLNLYSKFWDSKNKLDNGYGLKQMGAVERTLGILVAPVGGETQLRTKEYLGLVDRMVVQVKGEKLAFVNENLVMVIPLGETSCTK
jgi:hypothetical protein